jgi:hypothetical protein
VTPPAILLEITLLKSAFPNLIFRIADDTGSAGLKPS